jgi:hypothetical protein
MYHGMWNIMTVIGQKTHTRLETEDHYLWAVSEFEAERETGCRQTSLFIAEVR